MKHLRVIELDECENSMRLYGGRAGKKEGIIFNDEPWIIKYPAATRYFKGKHLPAYTTSPISEYISSHIYASLGIDVHETFLGYRSGKIVCACKDFTGTDKVLYEFSKVKTTLDDESYGFHDSPSDGESTYLADVLATIATSPVFKNIEGTIQRFWDMFVVDAFIKNPDRNNGNWGVLYGQGAYSLAPVYDNGSSLFEKRTDSLVAQRLEDKQAIEEDAFGTNTSAYLYVGEDDKPHHIHPYEYMSTTSDSNLLAAMQRFCDRIDMSYIEQLLNSVPNEAFGWRLMTQNRRDATLLLFQKRLNETRRYL